MNNRAVASEIANPEFAKIKMHVFDNFVEKTFTDSGVALPSASSYVSRSPSCLRDRSRTLETAGREHRPMNARLVATVTSIESPDPMVDCSAGRPTSELKIL